jgi:hypothetical protein
MMTIFLADGKMDTFKVMAAIINELSRVAMSPSWIIPTGSGVLGSLQNLPGGILTYQGPRPRIVKL